MMSYEFNDNFSDSLAQSVQKFWMLKNFPDVKGKLVIEILTRSRTRTLSLDYISVNSEMLMIR